MRSYDRITCFENARRIKILEQFRNTLQTYLSQVQYDDDAEIIDSDGTSAGRSAINRNLDSVHDIIVASHINPTVLFKPPGLAASPYAIDVVLNVLSLSQHHMSYGPAFDHIDRAIGIYQGDARRARTRTFNPVYWVGLLLSTVAELPFTLLGFIGFDRSKAETSTIGRLIKGVLYLVTVVAAFLTILQLLGYLDQFKKLFGI